MSTVNSAAEATNNALSALARTDTTTKKADGVQDRFLTLLTAQLRNQDPMNPMDNTQMTSQLAQISTVEGIEKMNQMMSKLIDSQDNTEWVQASALVGRGVLVEGKGMILTEEGGVGGFDLPQSADKVVVTIKDSNGAQVAQVDLGDADAGSHNFVWDGTTTGGAKAAPGAYTMSIEAFAGNDKIKATPLQYGLVTGVLRGTNGTDIQVGNLGVFQFDGIKQIL